jgi:hypothetical protein
MQSMRRSVIAVGIVGCVLAASMANAKLKEGVVFTMKKVVRAWSPHQSSRVFKSARWVGFQEGNGPMMLYDVVAGRSIEFDVQKELGEQGNVVSLISVHDGILVNGNKLNASAGVSAVTLRLDQDGVVRNLYDWGSRKAWLMPVAGVELPSGEVAFLWRGVMNADGHLETGVSIFSADLTKQRPLLPAVAWEPEADMRERDAGSGVFLREGKIWVVDGFAGRVAVVRPDGTVERNMRLPMAHGEGAVVRGFAPFSNGIYLMVKSERGPDAERHLAKVDWTGDSEWVAKVQWKGPRDVLGFFQDELGRTLAITRQGLYELTIAD